MLLHGSRLQLCDVLFDAEALLRCFGGEMLALLFLELLGREAAAFGFFHELCLHLRDLLRVGLLAGGGHDELRREGGEGEGCF